MHEPIAYTYEADHHCELCAEGRFGRDEHGDITGTDSEGNEVGALAPWDEWYEGYDYDVFEGNSAAILTCGTCGEVIERIELTS